MSFFLGFTTAALMRDTYYLSNMNKLKMAVSDYYNDDKEKMPSILRDLMTKIKVRNSSI